MQVSREFSFLSSAAATVFFCKLSCRLQSMASFVWGTDHTWETTCRTLNDGYIWWMLQQGVDFYPHSLVSHDKTRKYASLACLVVSNAHFKSTNKCQILDRVDQQQCALLALQTCLILEKIIFLLNMEWRCDLSVVVSNLFSSLLLRW